VELNLRQSGKLQKRLPLGTHFRNTIGFPVWLEDALEASTQITTGEVWMGFLWNLILGAFNWKFLIDPDGGWDEKMWRKFVMLQSTSQVWLAKYLLQRRRFFYQKFQQEMKYPFYIQCAFLVSHTVLKVIKQELTSLINLMKMFEKQKKSLYKPLRIFFY
jgi:hypothetical protein